MHVQIDQPCLEKTKCPRYQRTAVDIPRYCGHLTEHDHAEAAWFVTRFVLYTAVVDRRTGAGTFIAIRDIVGVDGVMRSVSTVARPQRPPIRAAPSFSRSAYMPVTTRQDSQDGVRPLLHSACRKRCHLSDLALYRKHNG